MYPQIQETATTNPNIADYIKTLRSKQMEWTLENLGVTFEQSSIFTKEDFERDLKKVSKRVKK